MDYTCKDSRQVLQIFQDKDNICDFAFFSNYSWFVFCCISRPVPNFPQITPVLCFNMIKCDEFEVIPFY